MSIADDLTPEARELLSVLTPNLKLGRHAKVGEPWRLFYVSLNAPEHALRFSDELVADMIARGLLYVTQAAYACPPSTVRVPYSARLDRDGEVARSTVLAETPRVLGSAA